VIAVFDTSVLLASLVASHPHHARAMTTVNEVRSERVKGCVAAHGIVELYAVLTRLPVSPRIGPDAAHRMIRDNVMGNFEIVALTAREQTRLIDAVAKLAITGGSTYDAIHAATARKTKAERLYTFNVDDFRRVAPDLIPTIVAP
jgi:predicted nucleic acid-binding protein